MQAHVWYARMSIQKQVEEEMTDYEIRVVSRRLHPFQGTKDTPSGTRQWRSELWKRSDQHETNRSDWINSLTTALADAEILMNEVESDLYDIFQKKQDKES